MKKFYTEKPNKIEWMLLGVVYFLFFTTTYYDDNLSIFRNHFDTCERFLTGQSLDILGRISLPYGVLHQWVCSLWVMPINILHHLIGVSSEGIFAVLWYKTIILIFLVLCIKEMCCVAETLGIKMESVRWMVILFASSILVVLPVAHVAQTDALYLFFMLKGFHALIKEDTGKFLLWFGASISFKMISVFAFIPLVLLEEKRILYVFRNVILGCCIIPGQQLWYRVVGVLNGLVFGRNEGATKNVSDSVVTAIESVGVQEEVLGNFYTKIAKYTLHFEFPILVKGYSASLFIFLFALVCIWCYIQKKDNIEKWKDKCLYAVVISLGVFFITASPGPYWIVIWYPFLFLLIYTRTEILRMNLLFEKTYTLFLFVTNVITTYWVYGGASTFDHLFLEKWGIVPNHQGVDLPNIAGYMHKLGVMSFMPIIIAICLAGFIGIVWVNYPKVKYNEDLTDEYVLKLQHGFTITNIAVLIMWYLMNVILLSRY